MSDTMSGMLNSDAQRLNSMPPMSSPILEQAEQKIEAGLAPDNRQNYMKVLVAGMAAAMTGGPNSIVASLRKSRDPVRDAAVGAVHLALILRKDARGAMPEKAMVPAAMSMMLRALDFINRTKLAAVGTPELVRATHIFTNEMFRAFRITPQMLQHATVRVHGIMQDPAAMAKINLHAGITRHPLAPEPTPMPPSRKMPQ